MALGFFRKRQKMIFVIMVVLMVSFLIGYQGFSMFFQKNPVKTVIGETPEYDVTLGMLRDARGDLQTLQWLSRGFGRHTFQGAAFEAMAFSAPRTEDQALLYALLLRQAEEDDFAVTESEVDGLIRQMKNNGLDFDAYAMHMRQNQGIPVKQLRGLLARWLLICKACQADQVVVPPSEAQLVQLFRDVTEKMNLQAVKIPAENFIEEIPDPTEEQVVELFEANRNRPAGAFAGIEAFSFGYLSPAKVKLAYLFISEQAVLRATAPSQQQIAEYLRDHEAELVKTQGEGEEAKSVPMSDSEKRSAAISALQSEPAQAKFSETLERIRLLTHQIESAAPEAPPGEVYPDVVAKMTLPGDDLLGRNVPVLAVEKQPLEEAVAMLAQQAEPPLTAIGFPYGEQGAVKIAPDLKITLNVRNVTVGEALAKIASQIPDLPKLAWGMCEGFDDVLFPVEGVRLFPVTAGQTGLDTPEQLAADPLLGKCFSQQPPASLAQLAMQVNPIEPKSNFQVGQDGPPLRVWDPDNSGAILWRVIEAAAPQSPQALDETLRKQIVHDWKLRQAFAVAEKKASAVKTAADLEAYIRAEKVQPVETGMFARKAPRGDRQVLSFQPSRLTALNFTSPAVDAHVIREAFALLAPKNLSADYSKESDDVLTLDLPSEGCVLIARRIDFAPAEKKLFEESKAGLIQFLEQRQSGQGLLQWFDMDNVRKRIGFTPKQPPQE
ncbi:MAG: hypothetical protein JW849_05535 [Phycisphaerae bacterium]|nr:hypothetical protein [Phycisphaerae bacterium]